MGARHSYRHAAGHISGHSRARTLQEPQGFSLCTKAITAPVTEDHMSASRTTKPAADAHADATTTVIAGLRSRLARAGTLNDPAVRCELRKLEELLLIEFDQAGHKPGRHRSPVSATVS